MTLSYTCRCGASVTYANWADHTDQPVHHWPRNGHDRMPRTDRFMFVRSNLDLLWLDDQNLFTAAEPTTARTHNDSDWVVVRCQQTLRNGNQCSGAVTGQLRARHVALRCSRHTDKQEGFCK